MWIRHLCRRSTATLMFTSLALFVSSTRAQESPPTSLDSQDMSLQAEDGIIREQLRRIEEQQKNIDDQQKILLESVAELRRLDARPAAIAQQSAPAPQPEPAPVVPPKPAAPATQPAADRNIAVEDSYEDSIVLVKTPKDAKILILLRFWDISQLRYTNSQLGNDSCTDHLGAVRPARRRNGFSLNRNMLQFTSYIFDKRLNYILIIRASNTSASVVTGDSSTRRLHCFPAMARQVMGNFRGLVSVAITVLQSFRDGFAMEI